MGGKATFPDLHEAMEETGPHDVRFEKLIQLLARVPSVQANATPSRGFGSGLDDRLWWVKFSLDVEHPLAWNVVQEFGHVLNYLSAEERLPTTFKPVSPPPYMNGAPGEYLSWVIECPVDAMPPATIAEWLEARLPSPVESEEEWRAEE
jgi:hypothetical protein